MSLPKPTDMPAEQPVPQAGPQPCTQSYRVDGIRTAEGNPLLSLSLSGPCGQWVVFFDPAGAESLADALKAKAAESRTGLHLPPSNGLHRA